MVVYVLERFIPCECLQIKYVLKRFITSINNNLTKRNTLNFTITFLLRIYI